MQDVQNIPNPDVNSPDAGDDFNSHPREDIERPEEDIPVPPEDDRRAPVEEPPEEQDKPSIDEDNTEPKKLV